MSTSMQNLRPVEPSELIIISELVVQAQAGDQAAFEKLYERFNGRILLYVIHMVGDDEVGYDLTQEVFIKAWLSLPSLRDQARFVSWLYRIATNMVYNHQHRSSLVRWLPWKQFTKQASFEEVSVAGPEEGIEKTELLYTALAQVSPNYRACLILYHVEGLSQRQIADRLGIKEASVSKYVSRGLEELRRTYVSLANGVDTSRERRRDQ